MIDDDEFELDPALAENAAERGGESFIGGLAKQDDAERSHAKSVGAATVIVTYYVTSTAGGLSLVGHGSAFAFDRDRRVQVARRDRRVPRFAAGDAGRTGGRDGRGG